MFKGTNGDENKGAKEREARKAGASFFYRAPPFPGETRENEAVGSQGPVIEALSGTRLLCGATFREERKKTSKQT